MDVLVVGDSLTAGRPGAQYTTIFEKMLAVTVYAHGLGGDTMAGISNRVQAFLPKYNPDVLIVEAGTNDVLLPYLKERGGTWKDVVTRLEARSRPSGLDEFTRLYAKLVDVDVVTVVVTIGCLGEDITSDLNRKRNEYNAVIRGLAGYSVAVADVGKAFDGYLKGIEPSTYLLPNYAKIFTDSLLTSVERVSDVLSARRGLVLTIDGVHLNRRGARVVADTLVEAVLTGYSDVRG